MGLKVEAYPGFKSFSVELDLPDHAEFVAVMMVRSGRHFYLEPLPFDRWWVCVDAEHTQALQSYVAAAKSVFPLPMKPKKGSKA